MSTALIGPNPFCEGQILIESTVLVSLSSYRQRRPGDLEAGGLLLGFRRGPHLHVTACTKPFPTDRRTRISFERECAGHAEAAYEHWRTSNGCVDYLGEWHSHPEAKASPSSIDLHGWRGLLRPRLNALLFVILGTKEHWYGIGLKSQIAQMSVEHSNSACPMPEP